jgi:hypothetical protein
MLLLDHINLHQTKWRGRPKSATRAIAFVAFLLGLTLFEIARSGGSSARFHSVAA